jgi:hypothetical protein
MVQVGSQKYRNIYLKFSLWYLCCSQNWLNIPVDHRHFGYNSKFTPQKPKTKKKKKKTLGVAKLRLPLGPCTWRKSGAAVQRTAGDVADTGLAAQPGFTHTNFFSCPFRDLKRDVKTWSSCFLLLLLLLSKV